MGTSVKMIEEHYSHLDAVKAIDQLRDEDSLSLLQDNSQSMTNEDSHSMFCLIFNNFPMILTM